MNLLERLGFATDVEATDRLGQRIAQSDLLRMIRNLDLPSILEKRGAGQLEKHWVFVFTPREPDSEHRGTSGFRDTGYRELLLYRAFVPQNRSGSRDVRYLVGQH